MARGSAYCRSISAARVACPSPHGDDLALDLVDAAADGTHRGGAVGVLEFALDDRSQRILSGPCLKLLGECSGPGLSGTLCKWRDLRVRSLLLWAGKDHVYVTAAFR